MSVAVISVWPGSQLPHVVVAGVVVRCLTASEYGAAYVLVVVGAGTEVAYL